MVRKLIRFQNPVIGSNKQVIYDPQNGYASVSHRRVGAKIHRQLYPNDRYNIAHHLVLGTPTHHAAGATHSAQHTPKVAGGHHKKPVNKSKISQSISKILAGGSISRL
jgi:hypothetical protein